MCLESAINNYQVEGFLHVQERPRRVDTSLSGARRNGPSSQYAANRTIERPVLRVKRPFKTGRVQRLVLAFAAAQVLGHE
ncbi:hypothetical protein O987_08905 [Comamonas testosteroni TK102]|uniref:Uncharacterized protein n=1 Tax=Comamonas testosteroni TK102 TaxID=1392005 RepID=A0A076PMM2_COMTE|nr:hypothetical protein O987_08905 [Comamonas testosteroni TK102]